MKGTEKQIRYATDIINKTISRIEDYIEKGTIKIEAYEEKMQNARPGYRDNWNRKTLEAWIEVLAEFKAAEFETAAEVIDFEKSYGLYRHCSDLVAEITGNGSMI